MTKRILYLGLDPHNWKADGELIHWPIIRIEPRTYSDASVQTALSLFESYTHVIITSKSAAAILVDYLAKFGMDSKSWPSKSTWAVGKATAAHLETCGIKPSLVAQDETSEGLIEALKQTDLNGAHLFWPHSSQSRPVLEDYFKAEGIRYTACVLYEPRTYIPGPLPNLDRMDEIVFTSPSTVDAFIEVFGAFPPHAKLTTIGPVTAICLKLRNIRK